MTLLSTLSLLPTSRGYVLNGSPNSVFLAAMEACAQLSEAFWATRKAWLLAFGEDSSIANQCGTCEC